MMFHVYIVNYFQELTLQLSLGQVSDELPVQP